MSGFKLLMAPSDAVYLYDGSLAGFYCCLHASVYGHEMPLGIQSEDEAQCSLMPPCRVATNLERATHVRGAIARKISPRALELCEHVFLSCLAKKEMAMLRFLLLGFEQGARVTNALADPVVAEMLKAEKHLLGEAHLLKGFIRFADHEGKLIASIHPKNFVLPLLAPHFADRYAMETLLIFDETHQVALVYDKGKAQLVDLEEELSFEPSETELYYQQLWKQFYRTIAIEARENPRCRMTHMPKRYWAHMVEMQPLL